MVYVIGACIGIVWLWFWIRGRWFAALVVAIPFALMAFACGPGEEWKPPLYIALPWAPLLIRWGVRWFTDLVADCEASTGQGGGSAFRGQSAGVAPLPLRLR